ncbi:N-methyl-L-tryptophan oxidase [Luethyella okanaganae]|uniref:N-methyl-L-tryptophan oxidase n=1 Tax=Luethyella okanaganae TaxID=69372 RepID=A0ABW1VI08_9MICO
MTAQHIEVAVVGLGAMGASALWRLAEHGVAAVGFEQFAVGHALGSTHGATRLYREACLEHPDLTPVAQLSRELFRELEEHSGEELLRMTGGVMIGREDSDVVRGTLAAASAHGVETARIGSAELSERYPQHAGLDPDDVGVLVPGAGIAFPEATVVAAVARARALGARTIENTRVLEVDPGDDDVRIRTAEGEWIADRVILTQGAWLAAAVPGLRLQPVRTPMTWFEPKAGGDDYRIERFPVFVRQLGLRDVLWGHGSVGTGAHGDLVKTGVGDIWHERATLDPDRMDRGVRSSDWSEVAGLMRTALPGIDPAPARVDPCMITLSPDDQFVVGHSPLHRRMVVGGGDSGHAFKHAPALGEILARAAIGLEQSIETGFMDPRRFSV